MGRYDIGKEPSKPVPEEDPPKQRSPLIEPMEVKICFDTEDSQWFINVKKEGGEWKSAWTTRSGGHTQKVRFDTSEEAHEWCKKKGLI